MAVDYQFIARPGKPPEYISEKKTVLPPIRRVPWTAILVGLMLTTQVACVITIINILRVDSNLIEDNKDNVKSILFLKRQLLDMSTRLEKIETAPRVVPMATITRGDPPVNMNPNTPKFDPAVLQGSMTDLKAAVELQQPKLDAVLDGLSHVRRRR